MMDSKRETCVNQGLSCVSSVRKKKKHHNSEKTHGLIEGSGEHKGCSIFTRFFLQEFSRKATPEKSCQNCNLLQCMLFDLHKISQEFRKTSSALRKSNGLIKEHKCFLPTQNCEIRRLFVFHCWQLGTSVKVQHRVTSPPAHWNRIRRLVLPHVSCRRRSLQDSH